MSHDNRKVETNAFVPTAMPHVSYNLLLPKQGSLRVGTRGNRSKGCRNTLERRTRCESVQQRQNALNCRTFFACTVSKIFRGDIFGPTQAPPPLLRSLDPDTNFRLACQRSHCFCFTKWPLCQSQIGVCLLHFRCKKFGGWGQYKVASSGVKGHNMEGQGQGQGLDFRGRLYCKNSKSEKNCIVKHYKQLRNKHCNAGSVIKRHTVDEIKPIIILIKSQDYLRLWIQGQ